VASATRASLRPEEILISKEPLRSSAANSIAGVVASLEPVGALVRVHVRSGGLTLVSVVLRPSAEALGLVPGARVHLTFKASAVHLF